MIWRFRFLIYVKHAPSFGDSGSSNILYTPPHRRFRSIIYFKHAPSFGDSGSSYILNRAGVLAVGQSLEAVNHGLASGLERARILVWLESNGQRRGLGLGLGAGHGRQFPFKVLLISMPYFFVRTPE